MDEQASELILYRREDGSPALEVRLEGDTVWLTQQQVADLFQTSKQNISYHVNNIFDEGELTREATVKSSLTVRQEGSRTVRRSVEYYNLDLIISVGYRVKSAVATHFRIWATERLRDYIVKGFAMDDARLKSLGGGDYWRDLLERIRDIRSSEKVLYRQVLELYATSPDYDPRAGVSREFFATIQNKLHYAAHGSTAAEVIVQRAHAGEPFMGLLTFSGAEPRASDVTVAKNYLTETELKRLNMLVSAYFDAAEFRAQAHQPTYMSDWMAHLDRLLVAMGADVLEGPGSVSRAQAEAQAKAELAAYRERRKDTPTDVERAYLEAIREARQRTGELGS